MLSLHEKRHRDLSDDSGSNNNGDSKNNDSKNDNKRPRVKVDEEHREEEESAFDIDDSFLSSPPSPPPSLSPQPPATSSSAASFPSPPSPSPAPPSPSLDLSGYDSDENELWTEVPITDAINEFCIVIPSERTSLEVPILAPITGHSHCSDSEDDNGEDENDEDTELFPPAHPTFIDHADIMLPVDSAFNSQFPGTISKVSVNGFNQLYVIKTITRNSTRWNAGSRRDSRELFMNLFMAQRRQKMSNFCLLTVDVERVEACERLLLPVGLSLQSCWAKCTEEEQRSFFIRMGKALQSLHLENILHLDVKSLNFIVHDNHIKLIDFESAHRVYENSVMEGGGVWLSWLTGTVGYMAPEIVAHPNGAFYGEAVEVFALGVCFYELATGKALVKIVAENIPYIFKDIILACVDKEESARPSVAGLLQQLEELKIE